MRDGPRSAGLRSLAGCSPGRRAIASYRDNARTGGDDRELRREIIPRGVGSRGASARNESTCAYVCGGMSSQLTSRDRERSDVLGRSAAISIT